MVEATPAVGRGVPLPDIAGALRRRLALRERGVGAAEIERHLETVAPIQAAQRGILRQLAAGLLLCTMDRARRGALPPATLMRAEIEAQSDRLFSIGRSRWFPGHLERLKDVHRQCIALQPELEHLQLGLLPNTAGIRTARTRLERILRAFRDACDSDFGLLPVELDEGCACLQLCLCAAAPTTAFRSDDKTFLRA